MSEMTGAELLVQCLEAHGVEYIFTVPGASIDPILNVLADRGPKIVVCRHEQNAAFMAQAIGLITGKPGVCLATAGPGLTNLVTGIATADAERCPVVAITGQIPRHLRYSRAHQNISSVSLFGPITKWSKVAPTAEVIPDLVANAFRMAVEPREGPIHLSIPVDTLLEKTDARVVFPTVHTLGVMPQDRTDRASELLKKAELPVMLLGISASKPHVAAGIRAFLKKWPMPVAATFQAAGAVSRALFDLYMGRLGVFRNQPGDRILREADTILSVGFDPIEYDPIIWNKGLERPIIHLDEMSAMVGQCFRPEVELIGDIAGHLARLEGRSWEFPPLLEETSQQIRERQESGASISGAPVHPLRFIWEMRQAFGDSVTVVSDVGSHQYWLARNYSCFEPHYFLTSMGFQTMGISIPFAIAAALARPGEKVVSVSGDGSFLMCSMELETAVRLKLPIIHIVWEDSGYDLVKIQEMQKYGRHSGATFGAIDTIQYAEAMGAHAVQINHSDAIQRVLAEAVEMDGPVVISVPIDYSGNAQIVDVQEASV